MNPIDVATRGLLPALLLASVSGTPLRAQAAPPPQPVTVAEVSTVAELPLVASIVQDDGDDVVDRLQALIDQMRAKKKDPAVVSELEGIVSKLKGRTVARVPVSGTIAEVRSPFAVRRQVAAEPDTGEVRVSRPRTARTAQPALPPRPAQVAAPEPNSVPNLGELPTIGRLFQTRAKVKDGDADDDVVTEIRADGLTLTSPKGQTVIVSPDTRVLTVEPKNLRVEVKPDVTNLDAKVEMRPGRYGVTTTSPRVEVMEADEGGATVITEIAPDGRLLARTAKKKAAVAADPTTTDVEAGIEDLRKELQSLRALLDEIRQKARHQLPR